MVLFGTIVLAALLILGGVLLGNSGLQLIGLYLAIAAAFGGVLTAVIRMLKTKDSTHASATLTAPVPATKAQVWLTRLIILFLLLSGLYDLFSGNPWIFGATKLLVAVFCAYLYWRITRTSKPPVW